MICMPFTKPRHEYHLRAHLRDCPRHRLGERGVVGGQLPVRQTPPGRWSQPEHCACLRCLVLATPHELVCQELTVRVTLASGCDGDRHVAAEGCQPRHRAACAEDLVVGVRRQQQHPFQGGQRLQWEARGDAGQRPEGLMGTSGTAGKRVDEPAWQHGGMVRDAPLRAGRL